MDVFDKHQLKIARSTLRMSDAGALIMGGMDKPTARAVILRITGKPVPVALRCDQCEMLSINGIACHESGCPNTGARYDDGEWIQQRKCFECGCTVDRDDSCCNDLD